MKTVRHQNPGKAKPMSLRLDKDLLELVSEWLERNKGINCSTMVNMAVREFITAEYKLNPVEVTTASREESMKIAKK